MSNGHGGPPIRESIPGRTGFWVHDVQVEVLPSTRPYWNRLVRHEIGRQLRGFDTERAAPGRYLEFRDIAAVQPEVLMAGSARAPKAFAYREDGATRRFYDLNRGVLLEFRDRNLTVYTGDRVYYSVPYLLQLMLLEDNRFHVHSAGYCAGRAATLVCGFGGIGKTALLARMSREPGIRLLGDDLNTLSAHGSVRAYHRPYCLYPHHKAVFADYFAKHRVVIRPANLYTRITRRIRRTIHVPDLRDYEYAVIAARDLVGEAALEHAEARLQHVLVAEVTDRTSKVALREMPVEAAASFAVSVTHAEWSSYMGHLLALLALSGVGIAEHVSRYQQVVTDAFRTARVQKVLIPASLRGEALVRELIAAISGRES